MLRETLAQAGREEPLLMWLEIETVRISPTASARDALRIYRRYMQPNAKWRVPIARPLREAVAARLAEVDAFEPNCFDDVQDEVLALMRRYTADHWAANDQPEAIGAE